MNNLNERYQWVANELNKVAFEKQTEGGKKLKYFMPCDKALLFTDAIYRGKKTFQVIPVAAVTICPCHNGLSEADLWKMFDEAGKVVRDD